MTTRPTKMQRVRSLISEHEPGSEVRMPTPSTVPSNVLVGLHQSSKPQDWTTRSWLRLQHCWAQLCPQLRLLPTPGQASMQEPLPTAQPQKALAGAPAVPAPGPALQQQTVLTLQQQGLTRPANLASQLLGSPPAAAPGTVPAHNDRDVPLCQDANYLAGREKRTWRPPAIHAHPPAGASRRSRKRPREGGALSPTLPHPVPHAPA